MPRRLKWLLLPLVWLVVMGIVLEGGLRLAAPLLPGQLSIIAQQVITGQKFETLWTPAWQHDIDHYYALRPNLNNELQYASPSVAFHVSTIPLWGSRIGFRTRPVDYFVDVVVVGDSFGFCLTEREDCWVTLLEQQTGLGVVNLSQWGTGSVSHGRILGTFGAPLRPPLVLWQFFGNDFNDDYGLAVLRGEVEEIPEEESDNPLAVLPDPPPSLPLADWLREHSVAFAVSEVLLTGRQANLRADQLRFTGRFHVTYRDGTLSFGQAYEQTALDMRLARNQAGLELSREAFREAQERVAGWGGQMVVIVIPTREEVYEHLTAPIMGEEGIRVLASAREAMLDLCDDLELTCLDVLPDFQARALEGEHLYYTDDLHLNPHGNALLAEVVRTWLEERDLLP